MSIFTKQPVAPSSPDPRVLNKKSNKGYFWQAFLLGLLLGAVLVAPVIVKNNGYFLYYGDFNVQEIPFYKLAHDSILAGDWRWNHLTDLGANFIGSYSFYLLGSPFFYLTLPLPSAWVAYAIGPLLALKLGFCSLTAYIWLRRYVRDRRYAVLGGLLYAFSGFSVYNIFFFHFHEAMIAFPLLLAALDEFHHTGRKGVVALAVGLCTVTNYYFFFGQAVFCLIYYLIKLLSHSYRFRLREFLLLALECIFGVMLSAILLFPSLSAIVDNYRVSQILSGWKALLYSNPRRYVQILVSFFFPPDIPAKPNFVPESGGKWASVAAYVPMFSLSMVCAHLISKKRSFFSRLFFLLVLMAFIPALNSFFQALNTAYYARWFYTLTLVMIAMTVCSLENIREVNFKKGWFVVSLITVTIALIIGFMPRESFKSESVTLYRFGIEESPARFWLFVGIALFGLAITYLLLWLRMKRPKIFLHVTATTLCLFLAAYSVTYIQIGKHHADYKDSFLLKYALTYGEDIELDDIDEARVDVYNSMDNLSMYWQLPTIQAFHSVVPASLMNYYNTIGVKRDVASRPSVDFYGIRGLTSVKYLFDLAETGNFKKNANTKMPGYRYLKTENGFDIYENENYVPMGFTYDAYMCQEELKDLSDDVKHLAMLKALTLTQAQMQKYSDITGFVKGMYLGLNEEHKEDEPQNNAHPTYKHFISITRDFAYGPAEYAKDCDKLREHSCSSFAYTDEGFRASFKNQGGDNLLFFSVPYDKGWTATVNGKKTEIEEVNLGFMAVRVDAHSENNIEFRYTVPLLKEGLMTTAGGAILLILYLILFKGFRAQRTYRRTFRKKAEREPSRFARLFKRVTGCQITPSK